jgi:hypothetical protein
MEIKLTAQESEKCFYDALCNGLNWVCGGYNLEIDYNAEEYQIAKEYAEAHRLPYTACDVVCFEDILVTMLLLGCEIRLKDVGYDGSFDSSICLLDVHERVHTIPTEHLLDMINEQGDGTTADITLQHVFFGRCIFG